MVRDNRNSCQKCKWAFLSSDKWVRFLWSNQYGQVVVNPERQFGTNDGGFSDVSFFIYSFCVLSTRSRWNWHLVCTRFHVSAYRLRQLAIQSEWKSYTNYMHINYHHSDAPNQLLKRWKSRTESVSVAKRKQMCKKIKFDVGKGKTGNEISATESKCVIFFVGLRCQIEN